MIFQCKVGKNKWIIQRENKKKQSLIDKPSNSRIDYENIKKCPFIMYYVRDIEEQTGRPITPF